MNFAQLLASCSLLIPLASGLVATGCGSGSSLTLNQPGMVVFGQKSLAGGAPNSGTVSGSTGYDQSAISCGTVYCYVADYDSARVLIFKGPPSSTNGAIGALGQASLDSNLVNEGYTLPSATSLDEPFSVTVSGSYLLVTDLGNSRVLIWNNLPTASDTPADVVVGQASFTTGAANGGGTAAANVLSSPRDAKILNGQLFISDAGNNRILVYNPVPTTNGASASAVIGQTSMTASAANQGGSVSASTISNPRGLWAAADGRLYVCDAGNNRVLIYNSGNTGTGAAANTVLGQSTVSGAAAAATATGMNGPRGLAADASGNIYVADYGNNRVLFFSPAPSSNGAAATAALGQTSLTSGSQCVITAPTSACMYEPLGLAVVNGSLYVADAGENRILIYTPAPTTTGVVATDVYGQPDFAHGNPYQAGPSAYGLWAPACVAVTSQYVVIGDRTNIRYLVFDKNAASSGSEAIAVIGQPDFVSTQSNQGGSASAITVHGGTGSDTFGCATDSAGRLYLPDRVNNRVLVYDSVPTTNDAPADYVLGQSSFTGTAVNAGANGLGWLGAPFGVFALDNTLFVADSDNNRVLAYDLPITSNQQLASYVIGQPNSTTVSSGTGASKFLGLPSVVYSDGTSLFVGDYSNRIMVFSPVPTATDPAAVSVIGQPDFSTSGSLGVTSAQQFDGPNYVSSGAVMYIAGMAEIDGYLFIPDAVQARIPGFSLSSLSTYMSATAVIGQPDLTSLVVQPPQNAAGTGFGSISPKQILNDPYDPYVWIVDSGYNRVIRVRSDVFASYINP